MNYEDFQEYQNNCYPDDVEIFSCCLESPHFSGRRRVSNELYRHLEAMATNHGYSVATMAYDIITRPEYDNEPDESLIQILESKVTELVKADKNQNPWR